MYVHIVIKKKIIIVLESRRRETTFPEQVLVGDTFSNNPRLRQNKNHQNKFPNTPRAVCRRLLTLFYPIFISWTKMSHFRWKTFILQFICPFLNINQNILARLWNASFDISPAEYPPSLFSCTRAPLCNPFKAKSSSLVPWQREPFIGLMYVSLPVSNNGNSERQ